MSTMTTPATQTDLQAQIDQHDVVAMALESAAVAATAEVIRRQVQAAMSTALVQWQRAFRDLTSRQSGPQFTRIVGDLGTRLRGIQVDPQAALLEYARKAKALGIRQGFVEAAAPHVDLPAQLEFSTHVHISQVVVDAQEKMATAPAMLDTLQHGSYSTVQATAAPAMQAANVVERAASTVTNTELNNGITEVANSLGAQRVWISERDACVVCLALSGHVVDVGQSFDLDATFGAKPMTYVPIGVGGLTGPPRHPHCRCRCSPWLGQSDPGVIDFPTALRREAERSVLRGFALPSESERIRTQAADRLLQLIGDGSSPSGWQVPKSVRARARNAIDKGTFTTGPVPIPKGRK
jgi:hypothetical protein